MWEKILMCWLTLIIITDIANLVPLTVNNSMSEISVFNEIDTCSLESIYLKPSNKTLNNQGNLTLGITTLLP